ncbi:hypothetical protein SprV_0401542900 [Sparganum proliferum]
MGGPRIASSSPGCGFAYSLTGYLNVSDPQNRWRRLRDTIQSAVLAVLARAHRQHRDWFDDNDSAIRKLIVEKNRLLKAYATCLTDDNKAAFYHSRRLLRQRPHKMQGAWTARKAEEIQGYADRNEWKNFFSAIKAVYGPPTKTTAPLLRADGRTLLAGKKQILQRWTENFRGVLNRPSTISDAAIGGLPSIFLLNVVGKIFVRILLKRRNCHLEQGLLPRSQCGFHRHHRTTDMIFAFRQLQGKCQEMWSHLYFTFVGLTRAFDAVNREGLWKIMQELGCFEPFTQTVRQLHDGMMAHITDNGLVSEAFAVTNGVKQDCVIAPALFSLMFSAMLLNAYRYERPEIRITYRTRGQLLNHRRIHFQLRVSTTTVHEILFADDCALNATTKGDMRRSRDLLSAACENFGPIISTEKTMVIHQPPPDAAYVAP